MDLEAPGLDLKLRGWIWSPGAGFAAPGTAFQVADWHAAADIDSEVDNRFDNQVHSNIVKQQEDSRGYIQTVESKIKGCLTILSLSMTHLKN